MKRRDFLWTLSAAAMVPSNALAQGRGGTVLYDSRAVALTRIDNDASGALWVRKSDLPRINGFELKPQADFRTEHGAGLFAAGFGVIFQHCGHLYFGPLRGRCAGVAGRERGEGRGQRVNRIERLAKGVV